MFDGTSVASEEDDSEECDARAKRSTSLFITKISVTFSHTKDFANTIQSLTQNF
jgi:hypothetical protein